MHDHGVDTAHLAIVGVAAAAGGVVNAVAGGGSLVTFPALVACGLPAITASATNTVAMCPGYLGATYTQRSRLVGQGARALKLLPVAAIGGASGAFLLLQTGAAAFDVVVPFLILFAVVLLGFQERIRARVHTLLGSENAAIPIVGLASVYGGYFGAGLGVIILSALAIVIDDLLVRLNALKQAISLAVNLTAAVVFLVIARLDMTVVGVMAGSSLVGGVIGGVIATRVSAKVLRALVVTIGLLVSAVHFVKLFAH
ncbi:sulfite exporter TauE/SafE family protein [soil metagenome]